MFYEEMRENIYSVHIYLQIRDMARGAAGGGEEGLGGGRFSRKARSELRFSVVCAMGSSRHPRSPRSHLDLPCRGREPPRIRDA